MFVEAAAVVALLAVLPACSQEMRAAENPPAAATPDFTPGSDTAHGGGSPELSVLELQDLAELLKAQKGKITVVNFWATWCPPCVKEMPDFAEFYREYQEDEATSEVALLSVSADHPDTIESALNPFIEKFNLPFPVHVMNFMPSEELAAVLGYDWVNGSLPATFVYDQEGQLRNVWFVGITKADLDKAVAKIRGATATG
jgi:thiol-disulfide isomerase/thioredoxin